VNGAFTRIAAIARKEFIHIFRDPRMLVAVLILPAVQLLLFAYAINFDVKHVPTVIVDQDRTTASRQYIATYAASDFFDVRAQVPDVETANRWFERSDARIAVVVPPGFARTLARGE
jgi:ABC-2 type transport system permease protein